MSVRFCDRCGGPLEGGVSSPPVTPGRPPEDAVPPATESAGAASHQTCQEARRFEPPRYCAHCGRRLVVQVRPDGWTARCAEHGPHHYD